MEVVVGLIIYAAIIVLTIQYWHITLALGAAGLVIYLIVQVIEKKNRGIVSNRPNSSFTLLKRSACPSLN